MDVYCFDHNRVVLTYEVPPESDYIHANRCARTSPILYKNHLRFKSKLADLKSNFILTQGPTDRTINDFWRMVWQEKPKYIVMLCKVLENNKPKCAEYWPPVNGTKTYGSIAVTNTGNAKKTKEAVYDMEKFSVRAEGKEIEVNHIRWLNWPDFGYF